MIDFEVSGTKPCRSQVLHEIPFLCCFSIAAAALQDCDFALIKYWG
jgi:hypothetical protein